MSTLYAEVLVNKKIQSLDRCFTYEVPSDLMGQVEVGSIINIPFGSETQKGIVIDLKEIADYDKIKPITSLYHDDFIFPKELIKLAKYIADYYHNTTIGVLAAMVPGGVNLFCKLTAPKKIKVLIYDPMSENIPLTVKQRNVAEFIADRGEVSRLDVLQQFPNGTCQIRALENKGIIRVVDRVVDRVSHRVEDYSYDKIVLTAKQQKVYDDICSETTGQKRPCLIKGVTGSGKTEIYLHLVEKMLSEGKESIILLPEIALTPQFIHRFQGRFDEKVVVLHSRVSPGERRDTWHAISNGTAKIVIGARSAIFAPCRNLGLIIIDEEHESSYKQDNTPRFHAREVAIERGRQQNALVVMGSATPSIESYEKALNGEYRLLTLDERANGASMPTVEIVDMRKELREGHTKPLSRLLIDKIADRLNKNQQIMLFLNRRGYNTFVSCRDCGHTIECDNCSVSMVYHRHDDKLRCHYCNHEIDMPKICQSCGSKRIKYFGLGTERLMELVQFEFPHARIARLDTDTTRFKGYLQKIYDKMSAGTIDILIGTQMIAKGWDFPNITLTGIIAADMALNLPDFRASEKSFQLLTQMVGRTGRGEIPGEVVLQTYSPDDTTIKFAKEQDYDGYYKWELNRRYQFNYPPFTHLIKVVFAISDKLMYNNEIRLIGEFIKESINSDGVVLGPALASISRINRETRYMITIKGENLDLLRRGLDNGLMMAGREKLIKSDMKIIIDVDPINLI